MADEMNDWSATKHRLQQRWPGLEDDELDASQGDRSALVELLQGRLAYARPNAEQDLDEILSGETVIPEDVADETTHTGTSGPVGPVSLATDFTGGDSRNGEVNNSSLNHGPAQTPDQSRASSTDVRSDLSDYSREPWEIGAPSSNDAAAGARPWHLQRSGGREPMIKAVGIVATAAALLLVGIWLKGRKQHRRTNPEKLMRQARKLGGKLSERAPEIEELRDKLPSVDARTLMSPKASALIGAAVTLLSAGILVKRRARKGAQARRVVKQAHQLSREISKVMTKLEALRAQLRSLDDDARGRRKASARHSGRGRSEK